MARTIVRLGDREWSFDEDALELEDAFVLKSASGGMALGPLFRGVSDRDPHCLRALVFWLRRPAEPTLRVEDVRFRPLDLEIEQAEDERADDGDAQSPPE